MCSFILSTLLAAARSLFESANRLQQHRGPDLTRFEIVPPFVLGHNLLHLTGELTSQPLTLKGSLYALFNGEIYNWRELADSLGIGYSIKSDGDVILPLYERFGDGFLRMLDGEFAIVVVNLELSKLVIGTDPFGTKPLFACGDGSADGLHVATYASALRGIGCKEEISMFDPNSGVVFEWVNNDQPIFSLVKKFTVFEFDLRQHKTHTNDWQRAFLKSVKKRTASSLPFIGLSSGFDSGAIQAALLNMSIPHLSFSIYAREDERILLERIERSREYCDARVIILSPDALNKHYEFLSKNAEPFHYRHPGRAGPMIDDPAASGISFICDFVRSGNYSRIYLSGSGADETISDYGFNKTKIFEHSDFGGRFPENLHEIFPWFSFYLGTQRDYLMKEEMVAGAHGIEGRYPFLDREVVQEYLWLTADVKNSVYKRPIKDFLINNNYPILDGKRGFDAMDNLSYETQIIDFPIKKTSEIDTASALKKQLESVKSSMWHLSFWRFLDIESALSTNPREKIPGVRAITCMTDPDSLALGIPVFRILEATVPFHFTNVCEGMKTWNGMSSRLRAYAEHFRAHIDSPDLFIVTDGSDVFYNDGSDINELFALFRKRIVISTEGFCGWGGAKECNSEEIEKFDKIDGYNRFLNAGAYIGTARDLLWLIEGVLALGGSENFKSDQRLFFEFYWQNKNHIALDSQQVLFGNFISVDNQVCENGWIPPCASQPCCVMTDAISEMPRLFSDFEIKKCQVNRKGKKPPIAWHGNGMGKMLFLAVLNKLAISCPSAAAVLSKFQSQDLLKIVHEVVAQSAHHQERTESWKAAQSSLEYK